MDKKLKKMTKKCWKICQNTHKLWEIKNLQKSGRSLAKMGKESKKCIKNRENWVKNLIKMFQSWKTGGKNFKNWLKIDLSFDRKLVENNWKLSKNFMKMGENLFKIWKKL